MQQKKPDESDASTSAENNNNSSKKKKMDLNSFKTLLTRPLFPLNNTTTTSQSDEGGNESINNDNNQSISDKIQKEKHERGVIRNALVKTISKNVSDLLSTQPCTSTNNKLKEKGAILDKLASTSVANLLKKNEYIQKNALSLVKVQRDMFLSSVQEEQQQPISFSDRISRQVVIQRPPPPALPYIINIANNYTSKHLKSTIMPTIVWLPSDQGPIQKPISIKIGQSLVPLYQDTLNNVIKNYLILFLSDDGWRKAVKDLTNGFILTKTAAGNNSASASAGATNGVGDSNGET